MPEDNWSDKYRENEGDSPEEAARKRKLWRRNAALNQQWQDEQLSIRDDITDEDSLGRALNEMGIYNVKEEGQAGFRRIMQRGLGYQQNLNQQNKDYYSNLWNREGLEQIRPGIWKDVRPGGQILYRDAMGYLVNEAGQRTGGHYTGTPYRAPGGIGRGGNAPAPNDGTLTQAPGSNNWPVPVPGMPPTVPPTVPPDNPPGGGPGGGGGEDPAQAPLRGFGSVPGMPSHSPSSGIPAPNPTAAFNGAMPGSVPGMPQRRPRRNAGYGY